jgi:hypothetical protein
MNIDSVNDKPWLLIHDTQELSIILYSLRKQGNLVTKYQYFLSKNI